MGVNQTNMDLANQQFNNAMTYNNALDSANQNIFGNTTASKGTTTTTQSGGGGFLSGLFGGLF